MMGPSQFQQGALCYEFSLDTQADRIELQRLGPLSQPTANPVNETLENDEKPDA